MLLAGCYRGLSGDDGLGAGDAADAASDGDAETGDDAGSSGDDGPVAGDYQPAPLTMRRLTIAQYRNSIADVFGPEVVVHVELDPDERSERFSSIGAAQIGTSEQGVQRYRDAAFDVAAQVFARREAYPLLSSCHPAGGDDACVAEVLRDFGRRLWRRAPSDVELSRYAAVVDVEYEDGFDPELGLQYAVAALVESPNFMYLVQLGEPDGDSGTYRLTSHEMAARLSYLLWDSTPDELLLAAAERDELVDPEDITAAAERMLDTPRGEAILSRFFGESWRVEGLDAADKDPLTYPAWNDAMVASAHDEFDRTLRDLLVRDADLRELFTARTTFADASLTAFYGATPSDDPTAPVELPPERSGLLTSVAVIGASSPANRSSVVFRGKLVYERMLCEQIPAPPDNIDTSNPSVDRTHQPCLGCHRLLDPLGTTFEHFDGIAGWRDLVDGVTVDASGSYDGASFDGVTSLAAWLADDPRVPDCFASQALSFAAGRALRSEDDEELAAISSRMVEAGHSPRELLIAIVTSPAFRRLAPAE
jgi:Protein of unknown function (DUF1592)/Protein of unknown function (DUF1588)/Protein of unknown function (DUF1585)/Protein of unknown function (DUF1595)/Protein of unknown function (DUF1587)